MAASQVGVGGHGPIRPSVPGKIPRPVPPPRGESVGDPGSIAMITAAQATVRGRYSKVAPFGEVARSEWFAKSLRGFRW